MRGVGETREGMDLPTDVFDQSLATAAELILVERVWSLLGPLTVGDYPTSAPELLGPSAVLRFLRGHGHDPVAAADKLRAKLMWWRAHDLDTVRARVAGQFALVEQGYAGGWSVLPFAPAVLAIYPERVRFRADRGGNPVMITKHVHLAHQNELMQQVCACAVGGHARGGFDV